MKYTILIVLIYIMSFQVVSFCNANNLRCEKVFEKSKRIIIDAEAEVGATEEINTESQKRFFVEAISAFISDSEYYLSNCTDSQISISNQPEVIIQLQNLISGNCPKNKSEVQFIDINKDKNIEVILHSVLWCNNSGIYGAGFSLAFFRDLITEKWKGYYLWPTELLEDEQLSKTSYVYYGKMSFSSYEILTGSQFKPKIFMLDLIDYKGSHFMAIESLFERANSTDNNLSIIRWDGKNAKEIIKLSIRDWCDKPYWIIEKDGRITIPSAKATERCNSREKKTIYIEKVCDKNESDLIYQ